MPLDGCFDITIFHSDYFNSFYKSIERWRCFNAIPKRFHHLFSLIYIKCEYKYISLYVFILLLAGVLSWKGRQHPIRLPSNPTASDSDRIRREDVISSYKTILPSRSRSHTTGKILPLFPYPLLLPPSLPDPLETALINTNQIVKQYAHSDIYIYKYSMKYPEPSTGRNRSTSTESTSQPL